MFAVDASSLMVVTVLRDQVWMCRLGSKYKNMRLFTRREGTGAEISRLNIEPWILADARMQACQAMSRNQSE